MDAKVFTDQQEPDGDAYEYGIVELVPSAFFSMYYHIGPSLKLAVELSSFDACYITLQEKDLLTGTWTTLYTRQVESIDEDQAGVLEAREDITAKLNMVEFHKAKMVAEVHNPPAAVGE